MSDKQTSKELANKLCDDWNEKQDKPFVVALEELLDQVKEESARRASEYTIKAFQSCHKGTTHELINEAIQHAISEG